MLSSRRLVDVLEAAAAVIEARERQPGQVLPAVWKFDSVDTPEVVIGVVASEAISTACRNRHVDFQEALATYVRFARDIALVPRGAPDVIATRHLRDVANEVRRQGRIGRPMIV